MHKFHVVQGQRRFQRAHHIHDGRLRRQDAAGIRHAADIAAFGEGHGRPSVEHDRAVERDRPHLAEVVPAVRGQPVRPGVACAALDDLDEKLRAREHVAGDFDQRACGVPDTGHRPDGGAGDKTVAAALLQLCRGRKQYRRAGGVLAGADGHLLGAGLRLAKRRSAVGGNLDGRRADDAGRRHPDHDVGVFLRHAGDDHFRGGTAAAVDQRCGKVPRRLPPHGHGDKHRLLSCRGEDIAHAVNQRPHAEGRGKVGAFADKIALADPPE